MDALEYIEKAAIICNIYDQRGECKKCPLKEFSCGMPADPRASAGAVEAVEKFTAPPERYVCPQCDNEEHSADAKYCKICGLKINN